MPNIYFKVTIEKNFLKRRFLNFLSLKNLSAGQFLGSSNSLNFKTSCYNLKPRGLVAKLCVAYIILIFERNYDVLKSKSACILLNKNINFNKNETESKMEKPTHSFRETNLVLQFI